MAFPITAFLFISLLISTTHASESCKTSELSSDGLELSVLHMYGKCSPFSPPKHESWLDTVLNMAEKDPNRVNYLLTQKTVTAAPIASGQVLNIGNYIVRAKLGTPGQLMYMVMDTSNDAVWVPCSGCTGCSSTVFNPSLSTSFGSLDCKTTQCTQVRGLSCPTAAEASPCQFNQTYGGVDSSFSATLSQDSLNLGGVGVLSNLSFGCINSVSGHSVPPQGLLGLGRGSMSLVSQLQSLYSGVFSYCLPSFKSYYFSGSLKLGLSGQPKNIRTTPLLRNPRRPSLYYVNLTGISVGKVLVPVAPGLLDFDTTTGAGTIIDSGTVITRFKAPLYTALRDEFRKQVGKDISSLGAFDTCFLATNEDQFPVITLHFTGMDLKLPTENTLIHSSSGSLACLAMAAASSNAYSVLNVIANLQQQNFRILFDLTNSRLGISREICN
ncbi:hypothetical protein MKW98_013670 [Papaver atlanticum]|uniref:Peptidase A1 domain-containing protein n=1 Tax=Papaver atlanticum TaxID=357466 RepID=A0AAD4SI90_9MAGN|nr:hypothetical protein MKW98_013670 [Papaver atlanticum]